MYSRACLQSSKLTKVAWQQVFFSFDFMICWNSRILNDKAAKLQRTCATYVPGNTIVFSLSNTHLPRPKNLHPNLSLIWLQLSQNIRLRMKFTANRKRKKSWHFTPPNLAVYTLSEIIRISFRWIDLRMSGKQTKSEAIMFLPFVDNVVLKLSLRPSNVSCKIIFYTVDI